MTEEIKLLNDILYENPLSGAIIRVREKSTGNLIVGIITPKYNSESCDITILTLNSNYIGSLFNKSILQRMLIYRTRYDIILVNDGEIKRFQDRLNARIQIEANPKIKEMLTKISSNIDSYKNNVKKIVNYSVKIGYKKYPKRKIWVFNTLTNVSSKYSNDKDDNFDMYSLLESFSYKNRIANKLNNKSLKHKLPLNHKKRR